MTSTLFSRLIIFFITIYSSITMACTYCSSYSTVCTHYSQQCTQTQNQCTSSHQVCNGYQYVCYEYDEDGECIYSDYECSSYSTICDSYTNVCTAYAPVCDQYDSVCNNYYYGQYVTVAGKVSATTSNKGIPSITVTAQTNTEVVSYITDANGNYAKRFFIYDDSSGKSTAQVCMTVPSNYLSSQNCKTVSVYDNCTEPTLTADFQVTEPTTGYLQFNGPKTS